jgi:leucyl-tRNA synthetase
MGYDFGKIERKWQKFWRKKRLYEPDLKNAKKPFYNLMMFPYPSAEGLHVGNMYAFTGSDIYGRFKRMQGYDVFEPIGLDGFGIHSENYALKINAHPMEQAKVSEKRFYKQLESIGNGFAWEEKLETYDPEYYKWTQWIFIQMFKHGLAYRKKAPVNWCPSCKTVLADEQVVRKSKIKNQKSKTAEVAVSVCERCETPVVKKDLEQWFFRITDYAERLLQNLERLDWSEKVKIAQKNWIGKSEGAELEFEVRTREKPNFVLLHGYRGSPERNFFPWLKKELSRRGYKVQAPLLPHSDKAKANEKNALEVLRRKVKFDKNTILLGHSLGTVVAMKAVQELKHPIRRLVLAGGFIKPKFKDHPRPFEKTFTWKFDFAKIKRNAPDIHILHDLNDKIIPLSCARDLSAALGVEPVLFEAQKMHICGRQEPAVLENCLDLIRVFTTRPDTLFGATYMVLAPEHPLVSRVKRQVSNWKIVEAYVRKAQAKSEAERIAEGREKTGVELKGIKAVNPATGKEIPVWVADYVLAGYGTGAIMAVPAHDERDFEFAKRYKLPIVEVISPGINPGKAAAKPYTGEGVLINSGKFSGMSSESAKLAITAAVGGKKKNQYRLRDWLISRQRYWGPPIPMIFCEACAGEGRGERREMPGWYPVPEKDLPVKLPYIKNFKPLGTGKSPLASVRSFYETKCPSCGGNARRETDVSDTFLDSAWYYIGFLAKTKNSKFEIQSSKFRALARRWLPVDMYIGGAEHSVLHLLYVRFLALALHDLKLLSFGASPAPRGEPFPVFRAHGLLIKEGAKMSKSKGNVVNPDEYIRKFGADVLRMYLMFLAPLTQGGDFRDEGIAGITRFLERVWKFGCNRDWKFRNSTPLAGKGKSNSGYGNKFADLERIRHRTIKKVGEDIENLRYNTAISALMIFLNEMESAPGEVSPAMWEDFLKMLAPFAPFISEELWNRLGHSGSVHRESWPGYNLKLVGKETLRIVVQVNGRVRDVLEVEADAEREMVEKMALARDKVRKFLGDGRPKRIIYVPGRLINFVV